MPTNSEFSVNVPTAVPVTEIALAKLRVYHSWPNIRSESVGGQQPNNSLLLPSEKKTDRTPDWNIVYLLSGSYQIEQISHELKRRIQSITEKELKIAIAVNEPTISSAIEINSLGSAVDINQSLKITVLGWPEIPPQGPSY